MSDPAPRVGPQTKAEAAFLGMFVLVGLGLFVAEVVTDYHPGKLAGLMFIVFWLPLLVLHEAGHAVAAWLVGWHVGRVVIGWGNLAWVGRVGTAVVELRLYAVEGFAAVVPNSLSGVRWKDAFVTLAGPASGMLLAAAVILAYDPATFFDVGGAGKAVLQGLVLAGIVQGVTNLIPHSATIADGEIPNDGRRLLLILTRSPDDYRPLVGARFDPETGEWFRPQVDA